MTAELTTADDSKELAIYGDYEVMDKVVRELVKGLTPPEIAKTLGLKPSVVRSYLDRWYEIVNDSEIIQSRGKEVIVSADKSFSMVVEELWNIANAPATSTRERTTALKGIADTEKTRVNVMATAGVLTDQGRVEDLLKAEKQIAAVKELLVELAGGCPNCKVKILQGLTRISGEAVGVEVGDIA